MGSRGLRHGVWSWLAGAALVVALVAVGGAGAANSASFTDPTGDSGAGLDVSTVSISNDDAGQLSIRIATPNRGSLVTTDALNMYLNTDLNGATGSAGYDYRIRAYGGGGVGLDRWDNANGWVESQAGTYSFSGGLTASVNRNDLGGTNEFTFWIATQSNGALTDRAPDFGAAEADVWRYPLTATPPPDTDRDGIADPSDACPEVPAGAFDTNRNGCPGPYPAISNLRAHASAAVVGKTVRPISVRIEGLPADGARVVVRYGKLRERIAAKSSAVRSRLLVRRKIRAGAKVVIQATKAGWIGFEGTFVVQARSPVLRLVQRRCIPAVGTAAPASCGRVDRGS